MDKMTRRAFGAAGFVLLLATSATLAQQQAPTVRVRGTVERIDGSTYVVKTRDGAELRVALPTTRRSPASSRHRFRTSSRARSWASPRCHRLMAANGHSKYTSFLRQCGELEKDTTPGIFDHKAQ